jgi:hypothetical protein
MKPTIAARIAELQAMPTPQLKEKWRQFFGTEPNARSREYVLSRLIHRTQEIELGGLPAATRKRLDALADAIDTSTNAKRSRAASRPTTGTVLVREFRGVEHRVTVTPDGFIYEGRTFTSLSRIAREIAGCSWSGPDFFGLKRRGVK